MPLHKDLTGADLHVPGAHKTQHENGGSDEISVAGLSGTLADAQPTTIAQITDATTAGKALLDDSDASAQRTTLGLGTVATLDSDTDGTLAANSDAKVATQKATKTYVDSAVAGVAAGVSWKQSVRVATTAAGTLATSFENGDTVDGVTLATGDRILIKDQAAGAENGIYIVAASGAPTRATDADSAAEIRQASMYVEEGTTNADTQWVCTTNAPITLGSTALAFAQLTSGGASALDDLSDVVISSPASGQLLTYNGTNWINDDPASTALPDSVATDAIPASPDAFDKEFTFGSSIGSTTYGSPTIASSITSANRLKINTKTAAGCAAVLEAWSMPSTPFTLLCRATTQHGTNQYGMCLVGLRNSTSGKFLVGALVHNSSNNDYDFSTEAQRYSSTTVRDSTTGARQVWGHETVYFKVTYDGTTITIEASPDGRDDNYRTILSEAASSHFTGGNLPDEVVLGANDFTSNQCAALFDYLRKVA